MRNQRSYRLIRNLLFGIALLTFAGLLLRLLSQEAKPVPPLAEFAVTATAKPLPTSTPIPTITPAPSPTPGPIVIVTLTPGATNTPVANMNNTFIRYTAKKPGLSLEDALQVVYSSVLHRRPGDQYEGKTITLEAVYGLVTMGEQLDLSGFANVKNPTECKDWVGPCNIELEDCTLEGKCTPTGKKLTKIIDRPMWILDYANTPYWGSGIPGQPLPKHEHTIYAVDEETKMIMGVAGYAPVKE